jgi:hypothetical protein
MQWDTNSMAKQLTPQQQMLCASIESRGKGITTKWRGKRLVVTATDEVQQRTVYVNFNSLALDNAEVKSKAGAFYKQLPRIVLYEVIKHTAQPGGFDRYVDECRRCYQWSGAPGPIPSNVQVELIGA